MQASNDQEHLRLLSIFHYVVGGLAALCSFIPIFHLIIGLFLVFAPQKLVGNAPTPAFIGWFFIVFAAAFIFIGLIFSSCVITAGRFIASRRHYTFCVVMAGIECIFMPLGTVLGAFTLVTLTRPSVKQTFGSTA